MISALKWFMMLLYLASIPFILHSANFQYLSAFVGDNHLSFLKYEVSDVYVGRLEHKIQIYNNASVRIKGGKLVVPIIRNETARHYVILHNISSSTQPAKKNDTSGNIYRCWNDITIDRYETLSVELNYYLVSFSINYLVNSSSIANYNVSSNLYRKYTQPEKLIESNDSEIVSTAQTLTANVSDLHEKALKIYNFAIEHLHYTVQPEEKGALWALKEEVGDCSEYSYLFVALCRAAGIPARVQAGFAFHTFSETLEDGHMWAEYYLENYGWIPVDATWRLFDTMDDKHFSSIRSVPQVIPYANFIFNYTVGPKQIDEKQAISIEPCSTNVFGDPITENTVKTVAKTKQAKFAIFLAKVFGTPLIFPSEVKEVEKTFLKSEIQLQNALDWWEEHSQIAKLNVVNALENVEKTLQNAWMLIVKAFTIFISISVAIMLITLFLLRRYQIKQNKKHSRSFIYMIF